MVDSELDLCVCGDYRESHLNGIGECQICSWNPIVLGVKCNEFRNMEEKECLQ